MANLMNKLFKNKSTHRFIISLKTPRHHQQLPKLSPSLIPQQTHYFSLTKSEFLTNPNFFLNPKSSDNGKTTEPLKFYPNFPFGFLLNPISSTGFEPVEAVEVEEGAAEAEDDDAVKVWADSVKKKRKKKMNKHKYKKLRKRLRRKT
ncbi:uncharacterized protein LOC111289743 [Durio zibethinus]|uniref:Small ribosomal subunit protein mS38 n=1 Tax=Durio zibethinus TaxID=66656 RepID=A0A6P5Y8R7_DURZI|nr:uncharacterized protein LOC111289743 [Durio zibethinus]